MSPMDIKNARQQGMDAFHAGKNFVDHEYQGMREDEIELRWGTNEKWYSTVSKEAIRVFESPDTDTEAQALALAVTALSNA